MKNTIYLEKYLKQLILLSQKGSSIWYDAMKIAFCFDKGCLLNLKIRDFGWKGPFFSSKISKRGCFSNLDMSMVYALVGSRGTALWHPQMSVLVSVWNLVKISKSYVKSRNIKNNFFFYIRFGKVITNYRRKYFFILLMSHNLNNVTVWLWVIHPTFIFTRALPLAYVKKPVTFE